jgi:hypothetical protein
VETLVILVGAGAEIESGLPRTEELLRVAQTALGSPVAALLNNQLRRDFGSYDFEVLLSALEELTPYLAALDFPALLP